MTESHIRKIGPHSHLWGTVHVAGATVLQACEHCGTRRAIDSAGVPLVGTVPAWIVAWIHGGDIEDLEPGTTGPKSESARERLKVDPDRLKAGEEGSGPVRVDARRKK